MAAFEAFCAGPAREAAGVYVLGDLFDQWIGDDQLREPLAARVAAALRGVAASGVPVGIIVGNRDFLLGARFAEAAGATLLPEQIVVDVAGTPTLLMHGDEMCTSRRRVPALSRVHARPTAPAVLPRAALCRCGARIGNWLRGKSRAATADQAGSDPRRRARRRRRGVPRRRMSRG